MKKKVMTILFMVAAIFATHANEKEGAESAVTISSANKKFSLSIGGHINLKASYDFNGSISSFDFITSSISIPETYDSQRKFSMDATTSQIDINGNVHSEKIGDISVRVNLDFHGGTTGSYTPRLRLAYLTIGDFLVGRSYTAFCDLGAATPNIDFQGPNMCPYIYTTQLKYAHSFFNEKLTLSAAIEYEPYQSSTLSEDYAYQTQYLPNVVSYVQYSWNEKNSSHIRLSGLYKSIPLYNTLTESNLTLSGWGTQLSGSIGLGSIAKIYYNGTYGEGITNYIQDLYSSGLDATMVSSSPVMTTVYGWQATASFNVTKRTMVSAGYSMVGVEGSKYRFSDSDYRKGEYLSANVFYALTSHLQLAAEVLWGSRTNNNGDYGTANRINTMVKYNF